MNRAAQGGDCNDTADYPHTNGGDDNRADTDDTDNGSINGDVMVVMITVLTLTIQTMVALMVTLWW